MQLLKVWNKCKDTWLNMPYFSKLNLLGTEVSACWLCLRNHVGPSLLSVGLTAPDILHKFHERSHHIKFFFLLLSVDARTFISPFMCFGYSHFREFTCTCCYKHTGLRALSAARCDFTAIRLESVQHSILWWLFPFSPLKKKEWPVHRRKNTPFCFKSSFLFDYESALVMPYMMCK